MKRPPRMPFRRFALFWLASSGAMGASGAWAQPLEEVVVVPVGTPDSSAAMIAAPALEAELSEQGTTLVSLHDARDRFKVRSRPAQTPSDSDLELLAKAGREAIEHVAFGRTVAAQHSVREVLARAERTLESLNRETRTARQILDACLALVRSALQAGKHGLGVEEATRCRRLVPDLAPTQALHPANVIGALAEADDLLRRMQVGRLRVQSTPEQRCAVYVNGRHLADATPFALDRAAAGEYRVQVECGATPARVHVVQLGDEPTSLVVDTEFDRALVSEPRIVLAYQSAKEARAKSTSHAVQLGRELSVSDIVLVRIEGERAELSRVRARHGQLVARTSIPWRPQGGFEQAALSSAVVGLSEGRLGAELNLTPTARPSSAAERAERATDEARSRPLELKAASPRAGAAPSEKPRWFKRPWLWTGIGAAVIGAAIGGVMLGRGLDQDGAAYAGTSGRTYTVPEHVP